MTKNILVSLVLFFLGLTVASAADETPLMGTVTAIEGSQIKLEVTGTLPVWAKKGGYLRAVNAAGEVTLRGAKIMAVEGNTITVTSTKAAELKVGDKFTLGKGKPTAGC